MRNISQDSFKEILIPVPPISEQIKIVSLIDSQFDLLERLKDQYQSILKNFSTLDQSILSKAFRGELVEQDPNDEPASVLLERIQQEREKEKTKVKQTGAKKLKK
jgi:type I restriction enzyme S subunit